VNEKRLWSTGLEQPWLQVWKMLSKCIPINKDFHKVMFCSLHIQTFWNLQCNDLKVKLASNITIKCTM